ncbi:transient receptor potential cation channel subfamily M member 2 [Alosa sapidissima]|uniref:transient receptor potential cation channel subfamily M member 2 n=1 Tax=Alosa sapidissima TaxID=34773 RepID=UPI001C0823DB|nr:transient receptor potential cation channel subfamily M member 2 [Alosa sapidissima]
MPVKIKKIDFKTKMLSRSEKVHPDEPDIFQLGQIGLSNLLSNLRRCSLKSWIKENIKKKECCFYVQTEREGFCKCGYPKDYHVEEAIAPERFLGQSWEGEKHMREVPTDAFGDIDFGGLGQNMGKYVRVSSDTPSDVLYHLITEYWKLRPPNLLISVTGGAKNFYMRTHLKQKFRRGLIKVAQSTGAWIITGGTHTGVMKHVGMAVRDYTLSSSSARGEIVAIGVAPWGIVHKRQSLVHPEGCFPANYTLDEQSQGRLSCLDSNHSHFLLVDDGTHGQYGVEIGLRSCLEKLIGEKPLGNRESHVKIPVVCVVLDGGQGTLNTIYSAMLNGTPCVVLEGSGRMADVIANVAGKPVSQVTLALIQRHMKRFFGQEYESFSEIKVIEWAKKIQDIIRMPHLLTVFRMDEDKNSDVDVAILQAFLKASRSEENAGQRGWERQLELAVAWNRVDIAESEIFTEESQWQSGDLHKAMFSALVGHKSEFVRLLLENGVSIPQFLSEEETLCELYTTMPSCLFLRKLVKRLQGDKGRRSLASPCQRRQVSLATVAEVVRQLLGSFTQPIYSLPPSHELIKMADENLDNTVIRDPGRDFFLWAVLQNNRELAQIAWEQCRDSTAAALAASKILKKLAQESENDDEEDANDMRELANHYEKQAIGVFSECHSWDDQRAQRLLIRISPSWGKTTCLRLALEANDKSFVAHSGVQALLTQIWYGELAVDTPPWKILLCMLFSPLVYTGFITYRRDEDIEREALRKEEMVAMESVTGSSGDARMKTIFSDPQDSDELKPLSCRARLGSFYAAPQVKFFWNIASYFGFLFLFSIVLMIDFQSTPSWREYLLYIWLTSLVFEEVRQLFDDPDGFGFRRKARMYINDLWNILDVASILLFIIGLACRWTSSTFYAGKVILCIDFIIFCLRLMAIFTISRTLGPKIIIVKRMMMDLFFFMFLLSIWVVAYGVAKQGILIHNEERLDWIIRGAVYEPYLIIFGNVPTNIDNAEFDISTCTVNGTDPMRPKCPMLNANQMPAFPEWLTIIMLCVYLLFANILLLNLLIAIFNYTFQEVQDNTDTIWKFQRYELIKEYHSRPAAPPPFILLSHIYLLLRRFIMRQRPQKHKQFRQRLSKTEEEELMSWETFMRENYVSTQRQEKSESMERRIQDTADRVGSMSEVLEREHDRGTTAKRLVQLEEQVSQSAKALQWIMDTLKAQGYQSKEEPPSMSRSTESEGDEHEIDGETEKRQYHFHARSFLYTGTNKKRFPVPEEKVPWEVDFTPYIAEVYSAEPINEAEQLTLDNYKNPGGRTGIRGRGVLQSLGPNPILDPVLTHWQDKDHSVLQFLAVWNEVEGCWSMPGGALKPGEPLPSRLKNLLGDKLYQRIKAKLGDGSRHNTVYEGYADDPRNTDNAWIETTVLNIHLDSTGSLMNELNRMVATSQMLSERIQWREVSSKTPVYTYQREALRLVAKLHQTQF